MTVLFALLALAVGIVLLFLGYRFARIAIPLWGFLAGLAVGGDVIASMSNAPFLGTLVGVFVGLMVGILFGVLAYFYYNVAVVVLMGSAGYWLGSSFITLFGFDPGFLSVTIGLAVGILFGILALVLNAPKYVLILGTSFAGAMATVGGLLLLFGQITLESFSYESVSSSINNSFFWTLLALSLLFLGIVVQAITTQRYSFEAWALSNTYGSDDGLKPHHGGTH